MLLIVYFYYTVWMLEILAPYTFFFFFFKLKGKLFLSK